MNWPAAKTRAEGAEMRKIDPERPQSKQRRGVALGGLEGRQCGKSAEGLRKTLSSLSILPCARSPEPAALPGPGPLKPPRHRRRAVPAASDRTPGDLAPSLVPVCPSQAPRESNPAPAPAAAGVGHSFTKRGRAWAVHDSGGELVALTLYRKGAAEVVRRLDAMGDNRA